MRGRRLDHEELQNHFAGARTSKLVTQPPKVRPDRRVPATKVRPYLFLVHAPNEQS